MFECMNEVCVMCSRLGIVSCFRHKKQTVLGAGNNALLMFEYIVCKQLTYAATAAGSLCHQHLLCLLVVTLRKSPATQSESLDLLRPCLWSTCLCNPSTAVAAGSTGLQSHGTAQPAASFYCVTWQCSCSPQQARVAWEDSRFL
jgi:hypothetical protein